jgi:DNA-binding transcriptional LysR family regulator
VELYQLRGFAAVAELGHLTRAAERLHVSQPALSAQIKALEDELDLVLFERGAGGMTLTAAGREVLSEAQRVIAATQSLRVRALGLHGQLSGRVSMGAVADPALTRVADVLRCAVDRYPLLEIDIHQEISGAAFGKVRDGELDASFYFGNAAHPAVASMPLRELAFRVVVPAAWAKRLSRASWEVLAAQPWIMTPPVSTHYALASDLFAAHGIAPSRRVEADHEAVVNSLVAAGLGVALMREDLAEHAPGIAMFGDTRIVTTLAFLYRREREDDPPIRALRDVVGAVWNASGDAATST